MLQKKIDMIKYMINVSSHNCQDLAFFAAASLAEKEQFGTNEEQLFT